MSAAMASIQSGMSIIIQYRVLVHTFYHVKSSWQKPLYYCIINGILACITIFITFDCAMAT